MLKMKMVCRDGVPDWQLTIRCDQCKEEISGGLGTHGVFAWEITAVGALRADRTLSLSAYETVTGETFHVHVHCLPVWCAERGGLERWMSQDIRSLPEVTAHALGVVDLDQLIEAGWWQ